MYALECDNKSRNYLSHIIFYRLVGDIELSRGVFEYAIQKNLCSPYRETTLGSRGMIFVFNRGIDKFVSYWLYLRMWLQVATVDFALANNMFAEI